MAVTKKKLSSYDPPKTINELKGNPNVYVPVVEKEKQNYVLRLDDLLNETYKDSRFPDSTSSNAGQTLVVNGQGHAEWVENTAVKWVTNSNTYEQVNDWYTKGYTILRKDAGVINMAYNKSDNMIYFAQLNDYNLVHYNVSLSQDNGWFVSVSRKHQLVKGGACAVSNYEAHDVVLSLNSAEYTAYSGDELVIDYMSYHSGAFFATLPYTGELFITGTRHNWSLGGQQSPVDTLININDTIVLTKDTRTSLGNAFELSAQELSRTDYRIDWDLIMRFRQGPMDGGAYMNWNQPFHAKISRTSGSSPIIIAGA